MVIMIYIGPSLLGRVLQPDDASLVANLDSQHDNLANLTAMTCKIVPKCK